MTRPKKPYGFVPLPSLLTTQAPVWHDGTCSNGRLSGEIRFELTNLTPLLVGWERMKIVGAERSADLWPIAFRKLPPDAVSEFVTAASRQVFPDAIASEPAKTAAVERSRRQYVADVRDHVVELEIGHAGFCHEGKSVLCPLRAPWGGRPVVIPGDTIKGLLRQEIGALLGAPMERVAERSYSYRPNAAYPKERDPYLIARLARVPGDGVEMRDLEANVQVRVPTRLELLPEDLRYDKYRDRPPPRYRFFGPPDGTGEPYRGGLGVGRSFKENQEVHSQIDAIPADAVRVDVPSEVQQGYLRTLRHLTDPEGGHFSARHPNIAAADERESSRRISRIREAAAALAFSPGDLVWVEWDRRSQKITSLGWHYYYRWAYQDSVRLRGGTAEREGLFPLPDERGDEPAALSPVRRLFGYTGDNPGSRGIGSRDHAQLMGRVSVNSALEVVPHGLSDAERFLPPTYLKELGQPRPSAVEFYLEQPYDPDPRPTDRATLVTYGDAAGYDPPGNLAGRKFYLDRPDAYTGPPWPWDDDRECNRLNDRSTLALEASTRGRCFRFTVRFRDLDPSELATVLVALCPDQFRRALHGSHVDGYCSKLGYARPLGWGSVRFEAKELHFLRPTSDDVALEREPDMHGWLEAHLSALPMREQWLEVHRHKHPEASDYPVKDGKIYTYHSQLRAKHSQLRRYQNPRPR